jgi:flagellar biosynthesis anti-sigma factor FlgM
MKKPRKRGDGNDATPAYRKGKARSWGLKDSSRSAAPNSQENDRLIEQARQIVDETPDIRPEKVEPLREAIESGTYEIDARKVANHLITKIILDS